MDIYFHGVCTHFWNNLVPGVRHRVVLPDASALRVGMVTGPFPELLNPPHEISDPASWLSYAILPHFASITAVNPDGSIDRPSIEGIVDDGLVISPCHLAISNAVATGRVDHDQSFFDFVRPLQEFFSGYMPSGDVVMGGRAAVYFDLQSGTIFGESNSENSVSVKAQVDTGGEPPELTIKPLVTIDQTVIDVLYTFNAGATLHIKNAGLACQDSSRFDYLLHYLTSVAGIPRALSAAVPGLADTDPCGDAKVALQRIMDKKNYPNEIHLMDYIETSASCSDSRYP